MRTLRSILRTSLHRMVHRCGFRLVRIPPFERSLRDWELNHEPFYFVQVGAHNGITSDPFHRFLLEGIEWRAILVEPQSSCIDVLRSVYADREHIHIVRAAIGPRESSTITLFKISDNARGLPHWANQLASARREVIASHRDRIPDIESWIVSETVPCMPLVEVVEQHAFPRVDLLAVDTEGFDFEIVRQIDNLPSLPQFIYYENLHLPSEVTAQSLRFLEERGYKTHAVNQGDTFAELRTTPHRRSSFFLS
jgi:FkbM family methyltransferase